MSRRQCSRSRQRAHAFPYLRGSLAIALMALSGCSASVTRFDGPAFGLTESNSMRAPAPSPPEDVRSYAGYSGSPGSQPGTSYAGYGPAPREQVATWSDERYRPASGQGSSYGYPQGGGYPQQRGYNTAPYPSSYPSPSEPGYRQPVESAPYRPVESEPAAPQSPPYRTVPTRVVSLPQTAPQPAAAAEPRAPVPAETRVPAASVSAASVPPGGTIEVQPGDTLYALAARHRVSISELMSVNGLSDPTLHPGQKLVLPSSRSKTLIASHNPPSPPETAGTPPPARPSAPQPMLAAAKAEPAQPAEAASAGVAEHSYTVKSGDSLYAIAVRHKVSLAEIQSLNGITDPTKVKPGTVLRLPASAVKPAAVPAEPASAQAASQPTIINAKPAQVAALNSPATASDASAEGVRPSSSAVVPPLTEMPPALSQRRAAQDTAGDAKAQQSEGVTGGKLRWPVRGRIIAGFGPGRNGQHNDGIKLAVPLGTEVHAAEAGVVAYAGNALKDYGNLVLLRHDNGWITAYAHNDSLAVKAGDRVTRGQVIARAGKTGAVDQPQLHFELRQGSSPVDPVPYLERL